MIAYGISQAGRSHVERGLPCQDSHCVLPAEEDGTWVAAIADGVGSAPRADVGAQIAARAAASFCTACLPPDRDLTSTYSMVRTAMNYALKQVLCRAEIDGEPAASYDTTLTLAIYDGARVVYGHAGDGGLFALRSDGGVVEVTTPQHGPDGETVIPLSGGYTGWEIGTYPHDVAGLLLATDGMRAALRPALLALAGTQRTGAGRAAASTGGAAAGTAGRATTGVSGSSLSDDPAIYAPLVRFFADPRGLAAGGEAIPATEGEPEVEGVAAACMGPHADEPASDRGRVTSHGLSPEALTDAEAFLAGDPETSVGPYYERIAQLIGAEGDARAARELARMRAAGMGESLVRAVRDDRTVAVLANPAATIDTSGRLYREPDWDTLATAWQDALYPTLAGDAATGR